MQHLVLDLSRVASSPGRGMCVNIYFNQSHQLASCLCQGRPLPVAVRDLIFFFFCTRPSPQKPWLQTSLNSLGFPGSGSPVESFTCWWQDHTMGWDGSPGRLQSYRVALLQSASMAMSRACLKPADGLRCCFHSSRNPKREHSVVIALQRARRRGGGEINPFFRVKSSLHWNYWKDFFLWLLCGLWVYLKKCCVERGGLYHWDAPHGGVWIPQAATHQTPKTSQFWVQISSVSRGDCPLQLCFLLTGLKLISSWLYSTQK